MGIKNYKRDKIPKYDDIQAAKTKNDVVYLRLVWLLKRLLLTPKVLGSNPREAQKVFKNHFEYFSTKLS